MTPNIADRNQQDEALLDSEERHRLIVEMCDHAILLTQPEEARILLANPAACEMFGYTQEELCAGGRAIFMDATDERWSYLLTGTGRNKRVRGRVRCIGRGGAAFLVEFVSIAFHDSKGSLRAAVHIRDISEEERTERELRESEMRWQFAVESHGDAMWDWDAERDELFLTSAAKELFNLPDMASKRPIADLFGRILDEDRASMQDQVDQVVAGNASDWSAECRLAGSVGPPRWIVTRGRVMTRTANGRPHRIVSISRDITQAKRRDSEVRRQSELTAHQARLVLLGELASALAHEINQPLTAIIGFAGECARQTTELPEVQELVRAIEEQAMRAGEIAWRMRGFARRQRLGRTALSLHDVVAGVAKWIHMDSAHLDVAIHIAGVAASLPEVDADRVELEQVLVNLLRNSIEAALPNARGQRIVIAANRGEHADEIEVTVTDWGCGLPATADLDAFKPFTSSKELGLGLGLTISFSIIEGHGGRLWATANPEGGTIFHFTLPVARQPVQPKLTP